MNLEIKLNRGWIIDEVDGIVGETNYVVPTTLVYDIWLNYYSDEYLSFSDFLENYRPEVEGKKVYNIALAENQIIKDIGRRYHTIEEYFNLYFSLISREYAELLWNEKEKFCILYKDKTYTTSDAYENFIDIPENVLFGLEKGKEVLL